MNAAEVLLSVGAESAIAIEYGDRRVTYGALRERVRHAAGAWQALGLRTGDRVIVFTPESDEWVVVYLGAIWAGGVAIGINPRLSMAELARVVNECAPRFVWCADEQAGTLVVGLNTTAEIVANGPGTCNWASYLAAADPIDPVRRAEEDAALWIGSSGTTGMPKGVIHAQRAAVNAHSFGCGILGLTAADRLYASSKLFFAYALGNSLFAGLRAGATVILDGEWPTPERVEFIVDKHRPTLMFGVPALYHKMLQTGMAPCLADRGIRHFVSAGDVLPPAVRRGWREATGHELISGYGAAETLCLMLYSDDDSGRMRPTPLTDVYFNPDVDMQEPQRIWMRHSTVALGYWNRPEAEADGFRDGWFSPRDMFLRDADGRLEYTGRNEDMLKIAGQWVSALSVEQSLASSCGEALQQIASVGVCMADGGPALAVLAVAVPGKCAEARRRMEAGIAQLPRHRRPRWVHWLDALPLTATGKLQRGRLRALHENVVSAAA